MEFTIMHDPADDIVTVLMKGEASLESVSKMMNQLAEKLTETKCNQVLVDVLALDHHLSLIELVTISGMMQSTAAGYAIDLKSLRRAMVVSANSGKMIEVYEIIAKYVSGDFKRFQTIEEAKNWLINQLAE